MYHNLNELEEIQIWLDQHQIRFNLNPYDKETIYRLIAYLADQKWFALAERCPRCNSSKMSRNGKYHEVFHRQKCSRCGKKFNDLTNTPFSWMHKPTATIRYLASHSRDMRTLSMVARDIAVSKNTICKWGKRFRTFPLGELQQR